jgi:hypothetical protein
LPIASCQFPFEAAKNVWREDRTKGQPGCSTGSMSGGQNEMQKKEPVMTRRFPPPWSVEERRM